MDEVPSGSIHIPDGLREREPCEREPCRTFSRAYDHIQNWETMAVLRIRLLKFSLLALCAAASASVGAGCSHANNSPTTLSQQRSALIGQPAPPGALDKYMAEHPKFHINTPPKK